LQEYPAIAAAGLRVTGYVRVHEYKAQQVLEMFILWVTNALFDLTERLCVDEIVIAMDGMP
jgi:hypothetical protein